MKLIRSAIAAAALLVAAGVAHAGKKYDEGASDTEIRIGNTVPYSGPLSAHGIQGRVEQAFFRMLNEEQGGINGRKITFISLDDAFSPPKTVEQTRKLVEQDGVLLTFASVGTAAQSAVQRYLNQKKIPQLMVSTGAAKFNQPKVYPWTTPSTISYVDEATVYGKYLAREMPDKKIVVLYLNDDFGRDYLRGLKIGLGDKADSMIVKELTYELTDPTIDSQILAARDTGAEVFVNITLGKATSQSLKKMAELKWKPVHFICSPSAGRVYLNAAGLENVQGLMTAIAMKQITSPRWADDPDVKAYKAFMAKYLPNEDITNEIGFTMWMLSHVMAHVLREAGDNLTRENILRIATNLKDVKVPGLRPGVKYENNPDNYAPIRELQLMRFEGDDWVPVGDVISARN
ncbi:ABC transporter substrate-binding protein [Camelimonas abortus]